MVPSRIVVLPGPLHVINIGVSMGWAFVSLATPWNSIALMHLECTNQNMGTLGINSMVCDPRFL